MRKKNFTRGMSKMMKNGYSKSRAFSRMKYLANNPDKNFGKGSNSGSKKSKSSKGSKVFAPKGDGVDGLVHEKDFRKKYPNYTGYAKVDTAGAGPQVEYMRNGEAVRNGGTLSEKGAYD